jgi:hypothetical protein
VMNGRSAVHRADVWLYKGGRRFSVGCGEVLHCRSQGTTARSKRRKRHGAGGMGGMRQKRCLPLSRSVAIFHFQISGAYLVLVWRNDRPIIMSNVGFPTT